MADKKPQIPYNMRALKEKGGVGDALEEIINYPPGDAIADVSFGSVGATGIASGWLPYQDLNAAGSAIYTFTHNLGVIPDEVLLKIKCTSTELGWAVDDVVTPIFTNTPLYFLSNSVNAVQVYLFTPAVQTKGNAASAITAVTPANWDISANCISYSSTALSTALASAQTTINAILAEMRRQGEIEE